MRGGLRVQGWRGVQNADREALATLEDGAGEVGGRVQQLQADQAALREQVAATQAALDAAKRQLAASKAAHEAFASDNRRAMCVGTFFLALLDASPPRTLHPSCTAPAPQHFPK